MRFWEGSFTDAFVIPWNIPFIIVRVLNIVMDSCYVMDMVLYQGYCWYLLYELPFDSMLSLRITYIYSELGTDRH